MRLQTGTEGGSDREEEGLDVELLLEVLEQKTEHCVKKEKWERKKANSPLYEQATNIQLQQYQQMSYM